MDDIMGTVDRALMKLLKDSMTDISPVPEITLKSPYEVKEEGSSARKISLFLYYVDYEAHLRNLPPDRIGDDKFRAPPLHLNLYYLITPYSDKKEDEKRLLEKVIQVFHDHPVVLIRDDEEPSEVIELKILPHLLSLDDMTKLWSAFQDTPYRLSVTYMVTPVKIVPTTETEITRVISAEYRYAELIQEQED